MYIYIHVHTWKFLEASLTIILEDLIRNIEGVGSI
jgi:hypothetical protein